MISVVLCVGLFLSTGQAQTGDWQAVQAIPPGSQISVKTQSGSARCVFENATDTELHCDRQVGRYLRSITFSRQSIRQVRLEHPVASGVAGAVVGTGIGVGTGLALTQHSRDEMRAYAPFYLGIGCGVLFAAIMSKISPIHGKVVYRH
jgi:hypothetical protein